MKIEMTFRQLKGNEDVRDFACAMVDEALGDFERGSTHTNARADLSMQNLGERSLARAWQRQSKMDGRKGCVAVPANTLLLNKAQFTSKDMKPNIHIRHCNIPQLRRYTLTSAYY